MAIAETQRVCVSEGEESAGHYEQRSPEPGLRHEQHEGHSFRAAEEDVKTSKVDTQTQT